MSKRRRGSSKLAKKIAAPKPPADPWDALGWLRFLFDWKNDWHHPGGLDYDTFVSKFFLSVVPAGWIKAGYGPTAKPNERKDIGRGHAAFLRMYQVKVFDALAELEAAKARQVYFPAQIIEDFFRESIKTIVGNDPKFFPDFWQAVKDWRNRLKTGAPLLRANHKWEFMVLTTLLEDPSAVGSLRESVLRKFPDQRPEKFTSKVVYKVKTRLGIR